MLARWRHPTEGLAQHRHLFLLLGGVAATAILAALSWASSDFKDGRRRSRSSTDAGERRGNEQHSGGGGERAADGTDGERSGAGAGAQAQEQAARRPREAQATPYNASPRAVSSDSSAVPGAWQFPSGSLTDGLGSNGAWPSSPLGMRRCQAGMSPNEKRDLDMMLRHQQKHGGRSPNFSLAKAKQARQRKGQRKEVVTSEPTLALEVDDASLDLLVAELDEEPTSPGQRKGPVVSLSSAKKAKKKPRKKVKTAAVADRSQSEPSGEAFSEAQDAYIGEVDSNDDDAAEEALETLADEIPQDYLVDECVETEDTGVLQEEPDVSSQPELSPQETPRASIAAAGSEVGSPETLQTSAEATGPEADDELPEVVSKPEADSPAASASLPNLTSSVREDGAHQEVAHHPEVVPPEQPCSSVAATLPEADDHELPEVANHSARIGKAEELVRPDSEAAVHVGPQTSTLQSNSPSVGSARKMQKPAWADLADTSDDELIDYSSFSGTNTLPEEVFPVCSPDKTAVECEQPSSEPLKDGASIELVAPPAPCPEPAEEHLEGNFDELEDEVDFQEPEETPEPPKSNGSWMTVDAKGRKRIRPQT